MGFTGTFTSRYIDTGELRQRADFGGEGPPLLVLAIPETGHRVAEQVTEEMVAMLTGFPAPYRENGGGLR